MIININNPPLHAVEISRQGENEFREIVIDVSSWVAEYPDGKISVIYCRPDGELYPVIVNASESPIIWRPTAIDTAAAGKGAIEVRIQIGDVLGKSCTIEANVLRALGAPGDTPAAPAPDWAQTVTEDADRAEAAAEKAEAASTHMPQISTSKTWLVWDANKGEYVDTGVSAAGEIPEVDDTLTQPGQPADAAKVGEELRSLSEEMLTEESDPTVPAWAKEPTKPVYTASEVGADPSGTAASKVAAHNTGADTHSDIRLLIQGLTDRLNALADSDDTNLDQLSEVVAYIKSNRSLIEAITTSKVSVADIVDNLTTNVSNKPLSAAQGVVIKTLIDALRNDKLDAAELTNAVNTALAQAKASGEFDGADGQPGKSAYEIAVQNGYSGTEAEWLASLKGDATVPTYEISANTAARHSHDNKAVLDGITAEKVTEWDSALHSDDLYTATLYPNFVNQLPISKDEQGDVYNGVGYKTYQQLNSDGTVTPTGAANVVSGYIPVKNVSIIRLDGFELPNAAGGRMVVTYDAEYNKVQHSVAGSIPNNYYFRDNVEYSDADQTKIKQFSISHQPTAAYLRICTYIDHMSENPIVTVDEEITYSETGKKFLPTVHLDYSQIDNVPETDTKAYTPILPTEHLSVAYSSIGRKPINTIEHFTDCAENYGYNGLKCDVRPTSDGELICCHDAGFSFDGNGKITTYNASDATMIHDVTAATCIGYEFATGEHPCLVGDYLAVCRKYGKVAFVTIRNEYMNVVIPKLISEINLHHMQGATIINSMIYASLVRWREIDEHIALNYTLERGANITPTEIDKAVALGNCSMSGFGFGGSNAQSDITCDFAYAASKGIRLTNAICQVEGSYENAIAEGYDGAHIGYPWGKSVKGGKSAYQYAVDGGYTGTEAEFSAKLAAEKFSNPNALTFTGAVTGSYDGSAAVTVNIPSAVTDAHINSLIDTKLGVIENGAY